MKCIFTIFFLSLLFIYNVQSHTIELDIATVQTFNVSNVSKISFKKSDRNIAILEFEDNLKDAIHYEINEEGLLVYINYTSNSAQTKDLIKAKSTLYIYSNSPHIYDLKFKSIGRIEFNNLVYEKFNLSMKSCSKVIGSIQSDSMVLITEASNLEIAGKANYLLIKSNSSNYRLKNFKLNELHLISKSSNFKIFAAKVIYIQSFINSNLEYNEAIHLKYAKDANLKSSIFKKLK